MRRFMPQVVKLRRRYPAVPAPRTCCAIKALMPAVKLRVPAARDRAGFPSGSCLHFWCCGGLYSDSRDVASALSLVPALGLVMHGAATIHRKMAQA